ncbi:hypothetical protein A3D71_00390 [Candidatus Kaiserbacteria bacterium RIFCSPHIGHO2_02_FULL_55_20]|uniref:Uncharacterized protein n=1 Tax=Candidatus Kaiserbacteria bacterium RIFCSPHIGHO2_02_FULL_55_20 TaxID=1798497 RepID=A0A1F6DX94_9BACT|nr:MAG: hypothetical protein A2680_04565 [Candidatus Kaiserbacteria bacterium RIFCSPHIGHO2_01_FULL_55_37]OGG66026.1 MAG: hypothetical protein A3D71_00390 [Candidatus Kaiserbacteria bacterium RIFCSPHIGHO2_02_FULL_55_20]
MSRTHSLRTLLLLFTLLAFFVFVPLFVHAQNSQSELQATIRGAILSDPRTASLSQAQIDSIVSVLSQEAQKQGITSKDIQWRPQDISQLAPGGSGVAAESECAGGFLCTMSEAFGFVGADTTIPFTLGAASMGLVWILAEMIHRRRHPVVAPVRTPPTAI